MPTAIIYYFTGTGHTQKVAQMIAHAFESHGVTMSLFNVRETKADVPLPTAYDYVGFGYPVHAFNSPQMFLRFAARLPSAPGKTAFIFKTAGEPFLFNSVSSSRLYKMLTNKGYDVLLDKHLLMPYNIISRYNDNLVKQMLLYNEAYSQLIAQKVCIGEHEEIKYALFCRIISAILRIEWPGARLNGLLYSINKKKCIHCMKCMRCCPTGNISVKNDRIVFGGQCAMCMGCVMLCPSDAVRIGLIHFLRLNGSYPFDRIYNDPGISGDFVNEHTKGYFRMFRKYYRQANLELHAANIDVPPLSGHHSSN